jgi:hypothetical protein
MHEHELNIDSQILFLFVRHKKNCNQSLTSLKFQAKYANYFIGHDCG